MDRSPLTHQWRALCVDADKGIFNYYCDTNIIMANNNCSYFEGVRDAIRESTDRPLTITIHTN